MIDSVQLDPSLILARQLYSAAVGTKGRIVIGDIVTTIARFLGIELTMRIEFSGPSSFIKRLLKL